MTFLKRYDWEPEIFDCRKSSLGCQCKTKRKKKKGQALSDLTLSFGLSSLAGSD